MAATSVAAGSSDRAASRSRAARGSLARALAAGPAASARNQAHSTRTRSRIRPASLNKWRTAASLPAYRPSRGESASVEEMAIEGCGRFECRITQYYRKRTKARIRSDERHLRRRFRCVTMDSLYSKAHIRESLDPRPSTPDEEMQWLAGASAEVVSRVRASLPARRVPAADRK